MGPNNRTVNHGVFIIRIAGQLAEDTLPDPAFSPPAEACMHHTPVAETLRQIPPWNPCTISVEYRFNKKPVVFCGYTHRIFPPRQQIFNAIPLIIPQRITS
jgi:hypothetical protein